MHSKHSFMKYFTAVFFFLLLGTAQQILAQQNSDNHTSTDFALELNDRTLEELETEKWTCQDRLCLEEEGYWNRTVPFTIEFTEGNGYTIIGDRGSFKGTYNISDDEKLISFDIPKEKRAELDGMLRGAYKLTKLTHDRLILTSFMDDDKDYGHIFRFVTQDYMDQVQNFDRSNHTPRKFNMDDYSDEDKMRFTIEKIKKVASSKHVDLPTNIENLTLDELNDVLKEIIE